MIRVKDIANMVGVSPTTVSCYSRKYKEGIAGNSTENQQYT